MSYASGTAVPVDRSKAEIERLLQRYGADQFVSGWGDGRALIGFRSHGKTIRFELRLPDPNDPALKPKRRSWRSTHVSTDARYQQEVRRLWRALALVVKAKLEAVTSGITTFEEEFMAHIVMPDNRTIAEHVLPRVEAAYASGKMQPLLPAGKEL